MLGDPRTAADAQAQPELPGPEPTLIELPAAPPASGRAAVLVSLVAHAVIAGVLVYAVPYVTPPKHVQIKVKITHVEPPKPEPPKAEPPKPIPPKPEPKKKPPEKKKKKILSERKPETKPVDPPKPVQGLPPSAVVQGGKGIAVPLGNTLMTDDQGKRLKAEDIKPLAEDVDLSTDARMVPGTVVTPKYTDEALDGSLEGSYTVDVFVDDKGVVTQAELRKKIGYGMDARLVQAAQQARFTPRKDRYGKAIPGWSEIHFRLEIPN